MEEGTNLVEKASCVKAARGAQREAREVKRSTFLPADARTSDSMACDGEKVWEK